MALWCALRQRYHRPMCGRARLSSDLSEIKVAFRIPPERPTPNFAASWNVAPTDPLPIVRYDAKEHQRSLEVMRWGLVPFWAKDIKVGFANINAKAEGIENKPAVREAFRQRRCLVPVDEEGRRRQAALRDRAQGPRADGAGGIMGELALPELGRTRAPANTCVHQFLIRLSISRTSRKRPRSGGRSGRARPAIFGRRR